MHHVHVERHARAEAVKALERRRERVELAVPVLGQAGVGVLARLREARCAVSAQSASAQPSVQPSAQSVRSQCTARAQQVHRQVRAFSMSGCEYIVRKYSVSMTACFIARQLEGQKKEAVDRERLGGHQRATAVALWLPSGEGSHPRPRE